MYEFNIFNGVGVISDGSTTITVTGEDAFEKTIFLTTKMNAKFYNKCAVDATLLDLVDEVYRTEGSVAAVKFLRNNSTSSLYDAVQYVKERFDLEVISG